MTRKTRTAVYSGSFNPLHIGHLAIIRHLLEDAGFDMVRLIVSPKNPLKNGISGGSGHERHAAALQAVKRRFPDNSRVYVDDIELNMPEPHYTIRTLDALSERFPQESFTLTIGADNLADIRRWKAYARILKTYGVAVYPRSGFDLEDIRKGLLDEDPEYKIQLLDAPVIDISSTYIRQLISEGKEVSDLLM